MMETFKEMPTDSYTETQLKGNNCSHGVSPDEGAHI
jgi:hypothetical protein